MATIKLNLGTNGSFNKAPIEKEIPEISSDIPVMSFKDKAQKSNALVDKAKEVIDPVKGVGEAALALGTGIPSFLLQTGGMLSQVGAEKLAQKLYDVETPAYYTPDEEAVVDPMGGMRSEILEGKVSGEDILRRGHRAGELLNIAYQPKTEAGQIYTEKASELLDKILAPARTVGEFLQSDEMSAYMLPFLGGTGATPLGVKAKGSEIIPAEPLPVAGEITKLIGELAFFKGTHSVGKAGKVAKNKIKEVLNKHIEKGDIGALEALSKDIETIPLERADKALIDDIINEAKVEAEPVIKKTKKVKTREEVIEETNKTIEELRTDPKVIEDLHKESIAFEAGQALKAKVEASTKTKLLRSTGKRSKPETGPLPIEPFILEEGGVIKGRKPRDIDVITESEGSLRTVEEPLVKWLEGDESVDIKLIEDNIKGTLSKLNHRNISHIDMIEAGDKMLTAINRKKGKQTQPGNVLKEVELREDMKVTEEELDAVIDWMDKGHESFNESVKKGEVVDLIGKEDPYDGISASMFEDIKTVFGEILGDEAGVIGDRSITLKEMAALRRLNQKLKYEGKNLVDYLKGKGVPEDQANLIMDRIKVRNPLQAPEGVESGRDYQDILADGDTSKIIKQRSNKSYKGKKIYNMPLTEADRIMLRTTPKMAEKALRRSFTNPIRTFEEMSRGQKGKTWKEAIYDIYKTKESNIGERLKAEDKFIKELRKNSTTKERLRIATKWISEQEGGLEILNEMNIKKVPELTPKELQFKDIMHKSFDSLWQEINDVRVRTGQRPMGYIDNYLTFFRTQNILEKLGIRNNIANDSAYSIDKAHAQHKGTALSFAKRRKRGVVPIELDPLKIYSNYINQGVRHIHMSPLINKVGELRRSVPGKGGKSGTLCDYNPTADKFLHGWSERIAGFKDSSNLPKVIQRGLHELGVNMAFSVLSGNARTVLIQPSVLAGAYAELGLSRTLEGILGVMGGTNIKQLPKELATLTRQTNRAIKKSKHLPVRSLDVSLREYQQSLLDYKGVKSTLGKLGLKPMMYLDMLSAEATWRGAYAKAIKDGVVKDGKVRKLSEKEAINYADDVTIKVNASGLPGDIAPIQASALGKSLTMFQTFVINNWGFLTRDVAGIGNKDITNPQAVAKVTRYVIGATLFNMIYEDVLGVNSPLPTPFRALYENRDEGLGKQALDVGREFLEPIPVIGSMRYGSNMLGSVAELAGDVSNILTDDPFKKPIYEVGGKILGVPYNSQMSKSYKASKRGENLYDIILGNYTGKSKKRKKSKSNLSRL